MLFFFQKIREVKCQMPQTTLWALLDGKNFLSAACICFTNHHYNGTFCKRKNAFNATEMKSYMHMKHEYVLRSIKCEDMEQTYCNAFMNFGTVASKRIAL